MGAIKPSPIQGGIKKEVFYQLPDPIRLTTEGMVEYESY